MKRVQHLLGVVFDLSGLGEAVSAGEGIKPISAILHSKCAEFALEYLLLALLLVDYRVNDQAFNVIRLIPVLLGAFN
jgi:hypothetical protein